MHRSKGRSAKPESLRTTSDPSPVPPAAAPPPSRLLNRDFVLLWQGQLVSQVGNQAFLVAQMFWLMEATGAASLMGLLLMFSSLPAVLLGPVAGTFVDRHSRKAIIVSADLARGIAVSALAVLLFARPEHTGAIVLVLFAVASWSSVFGAVFNPAIAAAIPDLVPTARLPAANSLHQLSGRGAAVLGQAAGGVAFQLLGAPLLFLVDGTSYLLSALSEAFIRLPRPAAGAPASGATAAAEQRPSRGARARETMRSYVADTAEGFTYVWSWTGMRTFVLTATAVNFLFTPVFVLLPFYVQDVLQRRADWYGFLLAALSLGSFAGFAIGGAVRLEKAGRARVLTAAFIGAAGLIVVLGLVRRPLFALVVVFGMGTCSALINIFVITLVQTSTPAQLRGRVMALVLTLAGAAAPLGMAAGGVLADLTGRRVSATYVAVGVLATALVILAATRRPFREFLATDTA